jgi:hypothetical protein
MVALHRRGKIICNHDENAGHENTDGGAGGAYPGFPVRDGTGYFTGAAADAFFRIALNKRTGLFSSHFYAP